MARRKNVDDVYESFYAGHLNPGNGDRTRSNLPVLMYRRLLGELCMNRFRWSNLPEEIDRRFLEMTLYSKGLALFFHSHEFNRFMVTRGTGIGRPNLYDNPTRFRAYLPTQTKTLTPKECVPIWSNYFRTTDFDIVNLYSTRLASLDRTVEIAALHSRVPFVIFAPEEQRLSYQNLMRQTFEEGEYAIFGTNAIDMGNIQAFPTNVDKDLVLNTILAKQKIWNEAMQFLGINNANQDKKERLVADEVSANDSQVLTFRNVALNSRRFACEQINRMYPTLDVSVDWGVEGDSEVQVSNSDMMEDEDIDNDGHPDTGEDVTE